MGETDRPFSPAHLVSQVHPAPERPADLELADGAALVFDEPDGMVLGLDRVDLGRAPAEGPEGPLVLADERPADLDAMTAHVDDRAAARPLCVPEPGAV